MDLVGLGYSVLRLPLCALSMCLYDNVLYFVPLHILICIMILLCAKWATIQYLMIIVTNIILNDSEEHGHLQGRTSVWIQESKGVTKRCIKMKRDSSGRKVI